MTLAKLILSVAALSVSAASSAAPFDRWFEHKTSDGPVRRIHGVGDEYGARFEDEEGRNLVYNPSKGVYEYAAREDDATFRQRALERLRAKAEETGLSRRWEALKSKRAAETEATAQSSALKAPPSHKTSGTIVGVTLLVDFPIVDANGNVTNTLARIAHPDVTADDLRELVNGESFTKYGNASSVREYYAEATSGHVDYTNVVVGWITAPHPREYYDVATKDNGTNGRALIGDVFDVIAAAPAAYIGELMQATANSDGEFLALNVLFAGPEATTWSYGLWAHQWVLSSTQYNKLKITVGSKSYHFYNYQISPVTTSPTIHTFCHESAHMICDFPDLYAYSTGLGNGVGNWCLMCGRTDDRHPQNFCAYLRAAAGWVTPKTLPSQSGTVTVTADLQDVWKYPHPTDRKQYYLIENRQAAGRDRELRASGIVIYRCDESGDNTTGAKTTKSVFTGNSANRLSYEVSVELADGLYEIERDVKGKYNGDANDTWFDGNGAELYAGQFNALSTPCARWTDGTAASINLSAFSADGETMTFFSEVESATTVEPDLSSAIYVNGISTKEHSSYENSSSATYWRVTDGRIVLRGGGPYVISGTGTTPVRCAVTDDSYSTCKVVLSNLSITSKDEDYAAFDCGTSSSAPVQMGLVGTNTLVSAAYSAKKSRAALGVTSGKTLTISGSGRDDVLVCQGGKYAAGIGRRLRKGVAHGERQRRRHGEDTRRDGSCDGRIQRRRNRRRKRRSGGTHRRVRRARGCDRRNGRRRNRRRLQGNGGTLLQLRRNRLGEGRRGRRRYAGHRTRQGQLVLDDAPLLRLRRIDHARQRIRHGNDDAIERHRARQPHRDREPRSLRGVCVHRTAGWIRAAADRRRCERRGASLASQRRLRLLGRRNRLYRCRHGRQDDGDRFVRLREMAEEIRISRP